MIVTHTHRETEREAETQAEGEAGSMHREPNVGLDPGSPGSPGTKGRCQSAAPPRDPWMRVMEARDKAGWKQVDTKLEGRYKLALVTTHSPQT